MRPLKAKQRVYEIHAKPRYILNEDSPRVTLTPEHYAYVKISEGCINACSYCVIPKMKGPHRSRPVESIVNEIKKISAERRVMEVNLIGQDTAAYGFDMDRTFKLPELLRKISDLKAAPWIRLLYAHPGHVTEELAEAMQLPGLCKYLDFPIEHSHDAMLARMNRGVTRAKMDWALDLLRKKMPGVFVRTTVIVGFPGETDEEFKDLMDYLKDRRFERLGAFKFSEEEGARAYGMAGQIPEKIKEERFNAVMAQQAEISAEINQSFVGKRFRVLIDEAEKDEEGTYYSRTEGDAPEVDGQVIVHSTKPLTLGSFCDVTITDSLEYDLVGEPA